MILFAPDNLALKPSMSKSIKIVLIFPETSIFSGKNYLDKS